ncbi:hypothetical protein [Sporolactobacillus laevolacticus]|uniref:hypothetical protein n=1 Tax=Sporolactobacillus laevolacticus TaxID=33018 RepID=UPI0025B5631E|nr:hypothetical protein [Sporolactobacillus laevolacticus]MDN3955925.1 hypothetical protein [Sporolactobacillus laevolacticus]
MYQVAHSICSKSSYCHGWLAFFEQSDGFEITQEQPKLLGDLHFKKIDTSDELFVIDIGGYIGKST